jgi:DNA-directed RNA polymerase subunit L
MMQQIITTLMKMNRRSGARISRTEETLCGYEVEHPYHDVPKPRATTDGNITLAESLI